VPRPPFRDLSPAAAHRLLNRGNVRSGNPNPAASLAHEAITRLPALRDGLHTAS
jgi:hypothetical protein